MIDELIEFDGVKSDDVGVLTSLGREKWHQVRKYLVEYDVNNGSNLECIEKSLFVFSLDESEPNTYTEMSRLLAFGNSTNRCIMI